MSSEFVRNLLKRWRFYAAVGLLPAIFSVAAVLFLWPNLSSWPGDGPREGYYWSASQYEKAFLKAREEVRAVASGARVERARLGDAASVLDSTGRRLLAPSELTASLKNLAGYASMAEHLARFDNAVVDRMQAPAFNAAVARELLDQFAAFELVVQDWSQEARSKDLAAGDQAISSIARSRKVAVMAAVLLCSAAALWLLSILVERKKAVEVARDRLEALKAEKVAKDNLALAVRDKTHFLSMVSHELRSPLQAILSSVEVLAMNVPPAERQSAIKNIKQSSLILGVQLRDLLTLARGEAGKLEIRPEPFEALALMNDVADVGGERATEKGLAFRLIAPKGPIFVLADVVRISQILANLVSNAIKYTERGLVTLELEPAPVGSNHLVFHVTDTGRGIPSARIGTVFEPFERVGPVGKPDESTGFGLTIVRTVVRHLGGTVEIDSKEGEGTRVTVRVPALIEDPELVHGDAVLKEAVLIVDDRSYIRNSIQSQAVAMGYHCEVADSAAAAANLLAFKPYYTVLIDLDMPVKSGIDLAAETRRLEGPNQNAYLVAMSSAAPERSLVPWPFDRVMEKPIERSRLERVLDHRAREQTR